MKRPVFHSVVTLFVLLSVVLGACAPAAIATPTATEIVAETATATLMPPTVVPPTPTLDWSLRPFTWSGSQRPLLMAHYMPWYQAPPTSDWGYHWTMNHFAPKKDENGTWQNFASHYTPLTGLYDSLDPDVLRYQAELMKLSGIDGVIVDWYGIENFWDYGTLNSATGKLFEIIKEAGLKFAICYEDQTLKHMVDNKHFTPEQADANAKEVMAYMQENWFGDDAYLKADGQPVLFVFGPQYYKSDDPWKAAFSELDPKPLFVTLDKKVLPSAQSAYPWPPMWASKAGVLDQTSLAQYLTDFYDSSESWKYRVGGAFPGFHDIYKEANVSNGYGYLDALEGRTFHYTLQTALDQQLDLIQLITWNDYGEGTNIEPTLEYRYQYLEMVQDARRATDPSFPYEMDDLNLPIALYDLRKANKTNVDLLAQIDEASRSIFNDDLEPARTVLVENQ